ncbi:MAG: hypothetical protein U1O81_07925 [Planktothrix rubescens PR223]
MTKEERDVMNSLLLSFSSDSSSPSLYFKLFDLLCREIKTGDKLPDNQIEEYLYNSVKTTAFPKLVIRLKMKLVESLSLNVNLEKKGAYSDRGKIIHQIRKKISASQILSYRGAVKQSNDLLDECITYASKYEFIEEWLTALRLRTQSYVMNQNSKMVDQCSKEFDRVLLMLTAVKKAQTYYAEICSQLEHKSTPVDINLLSVKVKELQYLSKQTKSSNVLYFQSLLQTHLYQERKQYINATDVLLKLISSIEKSPALKSPERLSLTYLNLAWNEILTFRLKNVLVYTRKAAELLPKDNINNYQNLIARFYTYFFLEQYYNAKEILEEMAAYNKNEAEYMQGKRGYFLACINFVQGQHKLANEILRDLNPLEKDTEGWSIWFKIVHIMNDIQLENTESAFSKIIGLRKQISRLTSENRDSPRLHLINDILQSLANNHFEFSAVRKKKGIELSRLNHKEENAWRITSPELIIFNQWFDCNFYKTKFRQELPEYWEPAQTA